MNKRILSAAWCFAIASGSAALAQTASKDQPAAAKMPVLTSEQRIAAAVLPLPLSLRDGAAVVAFSKNGEYTTVRSGTNGFVCIGPKGGESRFDAECNNGEMFPLLARAAVLGAQKVTGAEADRRIEDEVKAGKLTLPRHPVASYLMRGPVDAYDPSTGQVRPPMNTWQTISAPRQTGASLGLLEKPTDNSNLPWVMMPGTIWAHIMVMQR